jgi:hypothetical protein
MGKAISAKQNESGADMEKVFGYTYGINGFLLVGSEQETKNICNKYGIDHSRIESRPIRKDRKCSYNEDWMLGN